MEKTKGFESVVAIENAAEDYLQKLIPRVAKSDLYVSNLELELHTLRNQLHQEQCERMERELERRMQEMEVDVKEETRTESQSSKSPDIFDSPKVWNKIFISNEEVNCHCNLFSINTKHCCYLISSLSNA